MRILRWLGIALVALVAVPVGIGVVAHFSDGPIGPIPGGPLHTGTLMSEPEVGWSLSRGLVGEIEFQLVEPPGSRIVGALLHEGQLYVPCDLGFIARRTAEQPIVLRWLFNKKRWHKDALLDGRAVLRIDGKRYERQAVRVTDPELLATLRSLTEELVTPYFPSPLLDVPTDPKEIWFFRMDQRPTTKTPSVSTTFRRRRFSRLGVGLDTEFILAGARASVAAVTGELPE